MNVLSLFDGISCARVALNRAGIIIGTYYASEIDKYAMTVAKKNFPDTVHIGDIKGIVEMNTPIDLLIGGSPCQDLSIGKRNREGLKGTRSSLFWEYVRVKDIVKPTFFVLENVASMAKADKDTISQALGVEPIMIDASLVSAQSRKRLFWTNIPNITQPTDKGIFLKYVLQADVAEMFFMKPNTFTPTSRRSNKLGFIGNSDSQANRVYDTNGKSVCLSANGGGLGAKTGLYTDAERIRKLTPVECERLQGLPYDYTTGISTNQRYRCLGNAFNVDVIHHILLQI